MAAGTRSLPTDSPVPYFQPIERGHMSEGGLSDIDSQGAVFSGGLQMSPHHMALNETANVPSGGIKYHPVVTESNRLSTYMGLDDYDTLFEARHGRGALDHVPRTSGEVVTTSSMGIAPTTLSTGMIVNPMVEVRPTFDNGPQHPNQREHVPMGTDPVVMGHRVASPSSGHIIGEGAVIFTDMMETMLTALDQQMALSTEAQKSEGSLTDNIVTDGQLTSNSQVGESSVRTQVTHDTKDIYPDLYLPVVENYRISDKFYGYLDSLSTDNNPMILIELKGLPYQYGTSIYAVDRVNGTMCSKFDVGYRMINEKATMKPQFKPTSLEDEYTIMQPTYVNTLPGTTSMVTPIVKSTPMAQASQMPTIPTVSSQVRDILETSSNEQARAAYLERQIQGMSSVRLPSSMPSLEDGILVGSESLSRRIRNYCQEKRDKKKT